MSIKIQNILDEINAIKTILENATISDNLLPSDHDKVLIKMRNAYGMITEINPGLVDTEELIKKIEDILLAKMAVVVDFMMERKLKEFATTISKNLSVDQQSKIENVKREETKVVEEEKKTSSIDDQYKPSNMPPKEETKIFYQTIAEKNKPGKSVWDELSKDSTGPDFTSKMAHQPITDLEKAISLNEKFIFIKSLFGGNAQNYNIAIKKLNSLNGFNQAMDYSRSEFNWDENDPTVQSFIDLLRRRY